MFDRAKNIYTFIVAYFFILHIKVAKKYGKHPVPLTAV